MIIRTLTPWDILLLVIFIAAAVAFIPVFYANQPAKVVVYKDNAKYAEYELGIDREFTVMGYEGEMRVQIADSRVRILSSTCKEQICVKSGAIARPCQQLICAPNHVLIEIHTNNADREIDAITR